MQISQELHQSPSAGFCIHPSIHASVCPSLPLHCEAQPQNTGATSPTLTEIYKELFLFPPNSCQEKWQVTECLTGLSVLSNTELFTWRAEGCWSLLKGQALVRLNKVRSKENLVTSLLCMLWIQHWAVYSDDALCRVSEILQSCIFLSSRIVAFHY